MNLRKLNCTKAKMIKNGIKIDPATENDYRAMYKLFKEHKIEFYTYELNSEKTLKVVIRGIIHEISEDDVKEDLEKQEYPTHKVSRMRGRSGPILPDLGKLQVVL